MKKKSSLSGALFNNLSKLAGNVIEGLGDQELLFGTYADGKPRSFIDALRGDYISPKKKSKIKKSKKEKNKKLEKKLKKIKKEGKKLKKIKNKLM